MSSVGEEFPKEQARVREILGYYKEIGPPGMFGAITIRQKLSRADKAMASGNIIAILQSFEELKAVK